MSETILSIKEFEHRKLQDTYGYYAHYDGIDIVTDKQTIVLGIENGQCCCENAGYFISEDNTDDFINSKLLELNLTDIQLKQHKNFSQKDLDGGGCIFVDIVTEDGTLQFVAYNEHNGHYGHTAVVISKRLNIEEAL